MAVNLTTTLSAYKKVSITGDTDELEQRVSTLETEVTNLNKDVSDLSNNVAENTSNISTNTESISTLETSVDALEKKQDYDIDSLTVNDGTSLYGDTLIAEGLTVHGGIKQGKNFVNFTKSNTTTKPDNLEDFPSYLAIEEPCTILVTSTLRKCSKLTKDKWYGTKKGNSLAYTNIQLTTGELNTLDLIKKMTGIDTWKRTTIKEFLKDFNFTESASSPTIIFPNTRNENTEIFELGEDMSGSHNYLIPPSLKKAMRKINETTPEGSLYTPENVPTEIKGKYTAKCMIKFVKDFKKGVAGAEQSSLSWTGSMANLWLELQETAFKYNDNGSWNIVIRVIPHRFN